MRPSPCQLKQRPIAISLTVQLLKLKSSCAIAHSANLFFHTLKEIHRSAWHAVFDIPLIVARLSLHPSALLNIRF